MMIPTGLLQPHSESEYLRLEQMYFELGNFIRSLWVHTEGEDKENYEIFKPTLPIDIPKKEKKAPGKGVLTPKMATPDELSKGLERESWLK